MTWPIGLVSLAFGLLIAVWLKFYDAPTWAMMGFGVLTTLLTIHHFEEED